ncbi:RNA polymerase sigma factor [Ichthyenterobacterium magnum]|uniref:RNA polymerase sigma factor (Sigma-70 family) n=1 Tax=Ichthyenterobacterium magnum TaxID=1230530 RepID=A0A420DVR2_9FLAO|nr:sigma-70 family RNA polymerase sigma factor [Ichthyenterobacterium magnum]RKE98310.1 RNA polymerase sigma factor (sigma-70 family) [Ichthyenterobacterium magnum]
MQKVDFKSNLTQKSAQLVAAIKANDEMVLKSLYITNYQKIEFLVLKNNGTKEHAKDIYQDAFLAVWRNIKDNKFEPKNESSINGYLYTIAKNKWMDFLRSKNYKKTILNNDIATLKSDNLHIHPSTQDHEFELKLNQAMKAFESLGEPCKSLLKSFYFDKKSMKTIANELQIDAASVKNKKYRCMQKLRLLAQNLNKT